jgi:hypothetical protein
MATRSNSKQVSLGFVMDRTDWQRFHMWCKENDISGIKGMIRLIKWATNKRFMPSPSGITMELSATMPTEEYTDEKRLPKKASR